MTWDDHRMIEVGVARERQLIAEAEREAERNKRGIDAARVKEHAAARERVRARLLDGHGL